MFSTPRDLQSKQDKARIQVPQRGMLGKPFSPEKSKAYNHAFDSYNSSYRSKLELMRHVDKVSQPNLSTAPLAV